MMKTLLVLCLIFCAAEANFCPTRETQVCFRREVHCCTNRDCEGRQICCLENCGNKCKSPSVKPTNGRPVPYDPNCIVTD